MVMKMHIIRVLLVSKYKFINIMKNKLIVEQIHIEEKRNQLKIKLRNNFIINTLIKIMNQILSQRCFLYKKQVKDQQVQHKIVIQNYCLNFRKLKINLILMIKEVQILTESNFL